jgi:uncharacterized circularly permuted ATP-grasp superfamily protein/uncharacterized alpha-E superfamily protein
MEPATPSTFTPSKDDPTVLSNFGLSPDVFAHRQAQANTQAEWIRRRSEGSADSSGKGLQIELSPLRIPAQEWDRLRSGILQRLRAFSLFLEDIYGERRILREGRLPPEIVYEHPLFFPELQDLEPAGERTVLFAAVDLILTGNGEWQVVDNHFSCPRGLARLLQVRRIYEESLPEAFQRSSIQSVKSFPWRFYEHLLSTIRGFRKSEQIVLLSEIGKGRPQDEEELLAREMGIPLVQPPDLVVRNGHLYLKTIQGLTPVSTVYRRMEAPYLDPVGFTASTASGIPGLLQCIRQRTVQVINPVGTAIADNRALLRHADTIIRFYCGEQPVLKTVPTYYGYDADQAEWIEDHFDNLVIKTVNASETETPCANPPSREGLRKLLHGDPRKVVGQSLPTSIPNPINGKSDSGHTYLRLFCLGGENPYVLPGGLCQFVSAEFTNAEHGHPHTLHDVWIDAVSDSKPETLEAELLGRETKLPSSLAENMYWLGRYTERCLAGSTFLLGLNPWGKSRSGASDHNLLRKGVLTTLEINPTEVEQASTLHGFLQVDQHPNSPISALQNALRTVRNMGGYLDEEVCKGFFSLQENIIDVSINNDTIASSILEKIRIDTNRILGQMQRRILKDAAWQFFSIGQMLERGSLLSALHTAVMPHLTLRQEWHLRDETDLNHYLELVGSQHFYHQIYHSRAYLDRIIQLLWKTAACPMSLQFALGSIRTAVEAVEAELANPQEIRPTPGFSLEERIKWLETLPISHLFPARSRLKGSIQKELSDIQASETVRRHCEDMQHYFQQLHTLLDDTYFSHQAHPTTLFQNAF